MKKIILFLFVIISTLVILKKEDNVIPKESIRFRIIAEDNSEEAQRQKWELTNEITPILTDIMLRSDNINMTRENINNSLDLIDNKLKTKGIDYNISFGQNYFPKKVYNNITYDEGEYESLVITLGSGKGNNWWCVMFPPLCFVDEQKGIIDKDTDDKLREVLTEEEYELISQKTSKQMNRVQIKFKIAEIIQNIIKEKN